MLKEIQPSRKNYNEIELKIEDTQKLCNKYMLHKYELMVILEPFVLNYMTSNWDNERSQVFVI